MDNWKETAISVSIVLGVSMMLDFHFLPGGYGRFFAYFGIGLLPVSYFIFQKNSKLKQGLLTGGQFVFVLVLYTFLVLFFASLTLVFIDAVIEEYRFSSIEMQEDTVGEYDYLKDIKSTGATTTPTTTGKYDFLKDLKSNPSVTTDYEDAEYCIGPICY